METLQDYREEMRGTELGKQLETEVSRASRLRAGRNFWGIEVGSVEEMGDAGGDFHTGTKHKRIRKDIASTREGIAKVCEVLVHEDVHSGNEAVGDTEQHSEGLVHWRTQRIIGEKNDTYDEEVANINAIAEEIGPEKVDDLGKKKGAEVLLWMAYVTSKVNKGMEVEAAAQDGAKRIKAAA